MPEPMKIGDFIDLVGRMRAAQNRWFKQHDQNALAESKQLERQVDAVVQRWNTRHLPQQGELFAADTTNPAAAIKGP